jgi:site-specific DNA-cytosine methylase
LPTGISTAIASNADFVLVAGVEVEPKYADVWQQAHPRAFLYQADIRRIHAGELPAHDVLVASIPCTSHSTLGRCKIDCDHYATAIEILGQGVQTRIFREILQQLANFLKY